MAKNNNYTNSNNNDNPKNDNININNNDHKKYENIYVDVGGQYANRCEICIISVKTMPLHAHLNHLAEKCRVHVAKMILSS